MDVCLHECAYIHLSVHTYIHNYMHVCMHTDTYRYIYIEHTHKHKHTHTHVRKHALSTQRRRTLIRLLGKAIWQGQFSGFMV